MNDPLRRIIIPGGAGFLGRTLAGWLSARNCDVVVLSRRPGVRVEGARSAVWDGRTVGEWADEIDGASAVINLAGRSVNCRYLERNRRAMMDSRVESTRVIGEAIRRCDTPPPVWINSSTATIYKHTYDRPMDEASGVIGATPEAKDAFSIDVAIAWERAFDEADVSGTVRKIATRTAMVFGTGEGGVFRVLHRLVRLGLGGRMGHGRQWVSWVHETDFCRAIEWLIEHDQIDDVVNVASPNPVINAEMMRIFRRVVGMPIGLPATKWMLEIGAFFLRTETELIIKSRRVVPGRLSDAGFIFEYPEMEPAVGEIVERRGRS